MRDVVDAYIALAEATHSDIAQPGDAFNFSPQSRYTVLDIVAEIGRLMEVDPNPRILATTTMEIRDQTLDAGKAKARLGWQARWSLAGIASILPRARRRLGADVERPQLEPRSAGLAC